MTPEVRNAKPADLTREIAVDLIAQRDAGGQPAAYVIRHGSPTWVTPSVENVIANIPAELVESDPDRPGAFRVRDPKGA